MPKNALPPLPERIDDAIGQTIAFNLGISLFPPHSLRWRIWEAHHLYEAGERVYTLRACLHERWPMLSFPEEWLERLQTALTAQIEASLPRPHAYTGKRDLTEIQESVLEEFLTYRKRYGVSPSVRELGKLLGKSSSCTMQRHLEALCRKGYLKRTGNNTSRAWVPVEEPSGSQLLLERLAEGVRGLPSQGGYDQTTCERVARFIEEQGSR